MTTNDQEDKIGPTITTVDPLRPTVERPAPVPVDAREMARPIEVPVAVVDERSGILSKSWSVVRFLWTATPSIISLIGGVAMKKPTKIITAIVGVIVAACSHFLNFDLPEPVVDVLTMIGVAIAAWMAPSPATKE